MDWSQFTQLLPGWEVVIFFVLLFIFLTIGGGIAFYILSRRMWPYRFEVYENVAGTGYKRVRQGRARLISIGDSGEEIFFLKGLKKWRVAHKKRIGVNLIAWAIGEDGYWYNVDFPDLNLQLRKIGMMPIHIDVRYAQSASRKLVENRYDDKDFMQKYGTIIMMGMMLIVILAFGGVLWYVFSSMRDFQSANAQAMLTTEKVVTKLGEIADSLRSVPISGGTGFRPA